MEKKSDHRRNRFSFITSVAVITESVKGKHAFPLKIYARVNKFQHVRSFPWHGKQLALTILRASSYEPGRRDEFCLLFIWKI